MQILDALKANQWPTRSSLAVDLEVTSKTIQRDLDFMRDRLGLPIAYDQRRGGYCLTAPVQNFPMMELNEQELVSVFIGQKALAQYRGSPFEQPLRSAFQKLTSQLSGRLSVSWSDLDAIVSFRGFEALPTELETFQIVSEAVRTSRELKFDYKKLTSSKHEPRHLRPYHLACVLDQWYVIGFDVKRSDMRTFLLARMKTPRVDAATFTRPADFSIDKFLRDSFGVFTSKGSHTVELRFSGIAAKLVRERNWHPSQKLQELSDGDVELTLTLSNLEEIEPWVLSWGENVRVLGPRELIRRMRKTGEKYCKVYR